MMAVWRQTFPKLDWSDIRFYDGIPGAYAVVGQVGLTTGSISGVVRIYVKDYNPCDKDITFYDLTHELVHAVQIKSQPLPQFFLWKWLTCFFTDGIFSYYTSCYEKEAEDFAKLITNKGMGLRNPCKCSHSDSPFGNKSWFGPELNMNATFGFPAIDAAIKADMTGAYTKTTTRCSLADCFGDNIFDYAKGAIALVVSTVVSIAGTFFMEGPIASVTTVVGAAAGLIGGFSVGFATGGALGAIVGAVIGFIGGAFTLGLLGAIADWIFSFKTPAGGSLNIVESTDQGLTFKGKVTFEKTKEQPALAASEDRLFLGWTGTDDQLNVFVSPDQTKAVFEWSGPCGPALSYNAGLYIAWKGKGNDHPNCMSSVDGFNFGSWFMSLGDGPSQATPGIAVGSSHLFGLGRTRQLYSIN